MKFIVFLAALHAERLPFFKTAKHEYAFASSHSRTHFRVGRQTGSGVCLGLHGFKNDRVASFTRKILARPENPMKSALFNTLFKIKQLRWFAESLKLRNSLPLLRRGLLNVCELGA